MSESEKIIIPPYLQRGDRVAFACPAGYVLPGAAEAAITAFEAAGYEVLRGELLQGNSPDYFSGTDEQRLAEFQQFLDDRSLKAIVCARGGYGAGRIVDKLDFSKFRKHPKWIVGFSDITVLQMHVLAKYGIASLHAAMASAFKDGSSASTESLFAALRGEKALYETAGVGNRSGKANGRLVGGNLSLLAHLCGSKSFPDTDDAILFLEDIGEQLYHVDRMLYQLKRSGKFKKLSGLVIGGFTDMKDTVRPFGKTIAEMVAELTAEFDFPVCYDFPVSHEKENVALKIGAAYRLRVKPDSAKLEER